MTTPEFDPNTSARIEAWHELDGLLKAAMRVMRGYRTLADEVDSGGTPSIPQEAASMCATIRSIIATMEDLRFAILSTPVAGTNKASKFANAISNDSVSFTADDLLNAVPQRDHAHDFSVAIDVVTRMLPAVAPSKVPPFMTAVAALTKAKLKWLTTPRGSATVTDELRGLRANAISNAEAEDLLGDIGI